MADTGNKLTLALRILRKFIEGEAVTDDEIFDAFPGLRESEDERIRKALIKHFRDKKNCVGDTWAGLNVDDVLAYLERQKEQKQNQLEDYSRGYNDGYYHGITDSEQKPLSPEDKVKHPLYVEGFEAGKEVGRQFENVFGEQKPTESTEQQQVNQPEDISVSYDYKIGFSKGVEVVLKYPQDYGLCKPAEWSEEDEKKIHFLINLIERNITDGTYSFGDGCKYGRISKKEAIEMLKSLRPKPHWKPSEEQMMWLKCVVDATQGEAHEPLLSLYYKLLDLK